MIRWGESDDADAASDVLISMITQWVRENKQPSSTSIPFH